MSSFDVPESHNREYRELVTFTVVDAAEVRGKDQVIDRILTYVEEKTGSERFAKRADIKPGEMKDLLPGICFFAPVYGETGELEDVRLPLMGTNVVDFYGELTGKTVRAHPNPEVSSRIIATVAKVLENRCPTFAESRVASDGHERLAIMALYVPMSEDGETIDRFFVHFRVFVDSLLKDD